MSRKPTSPPKVVSAVRGGTRLDGERVHQPSYVGAISTVRRRGECFWIGKEPISPPRAARTVRSGECLDAKGAHHAS